MPPGPVVTSHRRTSPSTIEVSCSCGAGVSGDQVPSIPPAKNSLPPLGHGHLAATHIPDASKRRPVLGGRGIDAIMLRTKRFLGPTGNPAYPISSYSSGDATDGASRWLTTARRRASKWPTPVPDSKHDAQVCPSIGIRVWIVHEAADNARRTMPASRQPFGVSESERGEPIIAADNAGKRAMLVSGGWQQALTVLRTG
jgi:hypothetical protein